MGAYTLANGFLMYDILNEFARTGMYVTESGSGFDDAVDVLVKETRSQRHRWLYDYDASTRNNLRLFNPNTKTGSACLLESSGRV
jgi:hypothetical protein